MEWEKNSFQNEGMLDRPKSKFSETSTEKKGKDGEETGDDLSSKAPFEKVEGSTLNRKGGRMTLDGKRDECSLIIYICTKLPQVLN